jgi:hypothetical protein
MDSLNQLFTPRWHHDDEEQERHHTSRNKKQQQGKEKEILDHSFGA